MNVFWLLLTHGVPLWLRMVSSVADGLRLWLTPIIAGGALTFAALAWRREKRRDDQRDDERRRDQANQIAAWLQEVEPSGRFRPATGNPWVLTVLNPSALPVYDFTAEVWEAGVYRGRLHTTPLVPPGSPTEVPIDAEVTRAYRVIQDPVTNAGGMYLQAGKYRKAAEFAVSIIFRDAAGTVWSRDEHGRLHPGP